MADVATAATTRTPTVSCLMVTLPVPERLASAKRSIADFCRQTLPAKNLIVLTNGGEECVQEELREHIAALGRDDIQFLTQPAHLTLGELRNCTVQAATGEVVCQWDDDDLHHPERLERQLACLVEGDFEAVYLQEVTQYFPGAAVLYWTNWRATEAGGHPGTLMLRRDAFIPYPTRGETARRGEDLEVARALIARGRVGYLAGQPQLYVYVSHGANTWHDSHHRMLADELAISQALLRRREARVRAGMAAHHLGAGTLTFLGSNGPAFTL